MIITKISSQVRNPSRVNVFVDGEYSLSLSVAQMSEIGLKTGNEYSESEIKDLKSESQFGKLYSKALEYSLLRPRSEKEVQDYLWRSTQDKKYQSRKTGEIKSRTGVSQTIARRVYDKLIQKGYVDNNKFANWWISNRFLTKGISRNRLVQELRLKGVSDVVIEDSLANTGRDEIEELKKVISKKSHRYDDKRKLIQYLARQGFRFDDIKEALSCFNL